MSFNQNSMQRYSDSNILYFFFIFADSKENSFTKKQFVFLIREVENLLSYDIMG